MKGCWFQTKGKNSGNEAVCVYWVTQYTDAQQIQRIAGWTDPRSNTLPQPAGSSVSSGIPLMAFSTLKVDSDSDMLPSLCLGNLKFTHYPSSSSLSSCPVIRLPSLIEVLRQGI